MLPRPCPDCALAQLLQSSGPFLPSQPPPCQVVMASITGVGALTKPLMAMLLRDDGETALAAQLSNMPLLG